MQSRRRRRTRKTPASLRTFRELNFVIHNHVFMKNIDREGKRGGYLTWKSGSCQSKGSHSEDPRSLKESRTIISSVSHFYFRELDYMNGSTSMPNSSAPTDVTADSKRGRGGLSQSVWNRGCKSYVQVQAKLGTGWRFLLCMQGTDSWGLYKAEMGAMALCSVRIEANIDITNPASATFTFKRLRWV